MAVKLAGLPGSWLSSPWVSRKQPSRYRQASRWTSRGQGVSVNRRPSTQYVEGMHWAHSWGRFPRRLSPHASDHQSSLPRAPSTEKVYHLAHSSNLFMGQSPLRGGGGAQVPLEPHSDLRLCSERVWSCASPQSWDRIFSSLHWEEIKQACTGHQLFSTFLLCWKSCKTISNWIKRETNGLVNIYLLCNN